jgi:hypothetical protein
MIAWLGIPWIVWRDWRGRPVVPSFLEPVRTVAHGMLLGLFVLFPVGLIVAIWVPGLAAFLSGACDIAVPRDHVTRNVFSLGCSLAAGTYYGVALAAAFAGTAQSGRFSQRLREVLKHAFPVLVIPVVPLGLTMLVMAFGARRYVDDYIVVNFPYVFGLLAFLNGLAIAGVVKKIVETSDGRAVGTTFLVIDRIATKAFAAWSIFFHLLFIVGFGLVLGCWLFYTVWHWPIGEMPSGRLPTSALHPLPPEPPFTFWAYPLVRVGTYLGLAVMIGAAFLDTWNILLGFVRKPRVDPNPYGDQGFR